ncbi:helix-turn-helix transcriptional regulator [Pleomorphomonas sp. JP5]|uniref:AraC family transcriptional regulator n=1 Tax=Pleomorphomonas sp. JP5 TaxID=2942998 RepID=UPI0020443AD9|nr:helix-turn-helix domain-containing protein [Pleomorphomonas sp. JP5]MCM5558584.1 helix-turn-helix transcriptional regulator [Pleomorphomonas sp. JP5]
MGIAERLAQSPMVCYLHLVNQYRVWAKVASTCNNRLIESETTHCSPLHSHGQGQLTYIEQGVLSLEAEGRVWAVPPGSLHWIPAGVLHASRSHGEVRFWLTLVSDAFARRLPGHIAVLEASPLLVGALDRLRLLSAGDQLAKPLLDIVAHEVNTHAGNALGMRLPTPPRMRAWAQAFLASPSVKTSIDVVAKDVAMSRRSFTRHFEREVGMTFSAWKRAVIVHRATMRLAEGASVGEVALEVGYESVSAFIAMFRTACGRSPGEVRRRAEA